MAKELLHGPKSIIKTSGSGTIEYTTEGVKIIGNTWANQNYPQSFGTDYIEVNPSKTFYYDILYSNPIAGNVIYIGFERYDANKTSTSNSSTYYILSGSTVCTDNNLVGTVNLSTDSNGNPTKYIKLRILNQWSGSSATEGVLEIKRLSLLQLDSNENQPSIQKTGIISANNFRENNLNKAMIFKKEGIETNNFYEI